MLGPTASAKSEVGLRLAEELDSRILSVDSMQVYRGMDIGTAKPSPEERRRIPHGMIDLVAPSEEFSVAEFQTEARAFIDAEPDRPVVVVGGSGLHFRSVVDPYTFAPSDPVLRAQLEARTPAENCRELLAADRDAGRHIDLANPRRVVRAVEVFRLDGRTPSMRAAAVEATRVAGYEPYIDFRAVGMDAGNQIRARIRRRVDVMREQGLLDEVRSLVGRLGRTASQAVGYKELVPVVAGAVTLEIGFEQVAASTIALAKRQRTYFRRDPRISWLEWSDDPDVRFERAWSVLGVNVS